MLKSDTYFKFTVMNFKIHTPYSYYSRVAGFLSDEVIVDVVDTSVDNVKNNISVSAQSSAKPFYTNSDTPISIFGTGLLSTPYDPLRSKGKYDAKPQTSSSAAASAIDSNVASSAAASAALSSSNAQTLT